VVQQKHLGGECLIPGNVNIPHLQREWLDIPKFVTRLVLQGTASG